MIATIHRFIRRRSRQPMAVPETREEREARLKKAREAQREVHCTPEYPLRPEFARLPWNLFRGEES